MFCFVLFCFAVPLWIQNAAQQNYHHDAAVVARMAEVMKQKKDKKRKKKMNRNAVLEEEDNDMDTDTDTDNDSGDDDNDDDDASTYPSDDDGTCTTADVAASSSLSSSSFKQKTTSMNTVTAKSPLCLHCRKPTTNLCRRSGWFLHRAVMLFRLWWWL